MLSYESHIFTTRSVAINRGLNAYGSAFHAVATVAVRSVNYNMVLAYWLIGRETVQELQAGEERAEYGKQIISDLSTQLTRKYGSGFSITSLKYFRTMVIHNATH